jgi:hypothetical protein
MMLRSSILFRLFIVVASAIPLVLNHAPAQSFTGGFTFSLPGDDSTSARFLPSFPRTTLTDQDFVSIDANGHFSVRGTPTRFFGVNLVSDGAFPAAVDAGKVAGRMRKMGINLVRLHHMDNPWSSLSLFAGQNSTRVINETVRDRMEFLLSQFRENGIYANMNLHVSRTFKTTDGIPEADSLKDFSKYINYFDPHVLMLDKEFARQLLTHMNPYTHSTLVNDPVMAMIEITNENSLYRAWRDNGLRHFSQGGLLTERHAFMLDTLYRSYLRSRYPTTATLDASWNTGANNSGGTALITNGSYESAYPWSSWSVEKTGTALTTVSRDATTYAEGAASAKVVVSGADGTDWHVQWKHVGLSVQKDTVYVVTFAARSDSTRIVNISAMNNASPWTWYAGSSITVTSAWQVFSLTFRQPENVIGTFRLSFALGLQSGSYWFDAVDFRSQPTIGLDPSESFEAGNIKRILYSEAPKYSLARISDQSAFYIDLQKQYFADMRSFLRDSLGVRIPIVGTNWNVGPADLAAQSTMDYLDNHSYWDHPSFPGIPWSATNWYIGNTPMVTNTDGGTIGGLVAGVPMKGKPFTISEYNHAFPNRYQSEAMLFSAAYGAFHDVDGIMFFEYSSSASEWTTDRVSGYFSIHRNTAMMSLFPSCAYAYRSGLISPAQQTIELAYAPSDYLTIPKNDNSGWLGSSVIPRTVALQHAVRTSSFSSPVPLNLAALPNAPVPPYQSDTKQIVWDPNGLLSVAAPRFVGGSGKLDTYENTRIGNVRITYGSGFGTFTWLSLTEDSLVIADRSLFTVSTRVQNTGMQWDGTTSIHDQWGTSPTQVAPFGLVLEAIIIADSVRVVPLNALGQESGTGSIIRPSAPNTFSIPLDISVQQTAWFGMERFSASSHGGNGGGLLPNETRIESTFPNPFNGQAIIRLAIAETGTVALRLHDVLGREIETVAVGEFTPGMYDIPLKGDRLSSGVYYCVLTTRTKIDSRKVVLLK